jgi:hypothetical protein
MTSLVVDPVALDMIMLGDSPAIVALLRSVYNRGLEPEDCARQLADFLKPRDRAERIRSFAELADVAHLEQEIARYRRGNTKT